MKKQISKKNNFLPQIRQLAIATAVIGFFAAFIGTVLTLDLFYSYAGQTFIGDNLRDYIIYAVAVVDLVVVALAFAIGIKMMKGNESIKKYSNANLGAGLIVMAALTLFLMCVYVVIAFVLNVKQTKIASVFILLLVLLAFAQSLISSFIAHALKDKKN